MNPIFYNPYFFPFIPTNCDLPPTIYSIMQSIVNFGKDEKIKTRDLAKVARETIFDFNYPLSNVINKEEFECNILNHFIMRRINYDTVTYFKLMLENKLNVIMPKYNKMFDMMSNWLPFDDGETQTHISNDIRNINRDSTNNANNTLTNESTTNSSLISDNRYSNTPQNQLQNVKDGKYVTEYTYKQDNNTSDDSSTSKGTSNNTANEITKDEYNVNETWKKTISDKITLYKEFQENVNNIYDMIYNELEVLFYGLGG